MMDMEKVETDNIAVVQARALKKYCDDHEGCCGCVFAVCFFVGANSSRYVRIEDEEDD